MKQLAGSVRSLNRQLIVFTVAASFILRASADTFVIGNPWADGNGDAFGKTTSSDGSIAHDGARAVGFTAGDVPSTLSKIKLRLAPRVGQAIVRLRLFSGSESGPTPNTPLGVAFTPLTLPPPPAPTTPPTPVPSAEYTFTPIGSFPITEGTTYWIVVDNDDNNGTTFDWRMSTERTRKGSIPVMAQSSTWIKSVTATTDDFSGTIDEPDQAPDFSVYADNFAIGNPGATATADVGGPIGQAGSYAIGFSTGQSQSMLSKIKLKIAPTTGIPVARVRLFSNIHDESASTDKPAPNGALAASFNTVTLNGQAGAPVEVTFTASSAVTLSPNTIFWVVLDNTQASTFLQLKRSGGSGTFPTAAPNYTWQSAWVSTDDNWVPPTAGTGVFSQLDVIPDFIVYDTQRTLSTVTKWPVRPGFRPGDGDAFDQFYSSPVISSSGIVYIAGFQESVPSGDGLGTAECQLYAINPDGTTYWKRSLGNVIADSYFKGPHSSPALAPDGAIYVGTASRSIKAFNPDGSTRWTYGEALGDNQGGPMRCAPIIRPDTSNPNVRWIIAFWQHDDDLNDYRSTSAFVDILKETSGSVQLVKHYPPGVFGRAISSPTLSRDDVLYFGTAVMPKVRISGQDNTHTGHVYAYDISPAFASPPQDPILKWQYPGSDDQIGPVMGSPAIGVDGTIYVPTQFIFDSASPANPTKCGSLLALDPATGALKWKYETLTPVVGQPTTYQGAIDSSPAIGRDGTIYVGVDGPVNALLAINPLTHTPDWIFTDGDATRPFETSPVVAADDTIYIRATAGESGSYPESVLFGINPDGTLASRSVLDHETPNDHQNNDFSSLGSSTPYSSIALTEDGRLYSASAPPASSTSIGIGGVIWCFQIPVGPHFWPRFHGNNLNTGNVQDNKWTSKSAPTIQIVELPRGFSDPYDVSAQAAYAINQYGVITGYSPAQTYNGSIYSSACIWVPNNSTWYPFTYTSSPYGTTWGRAIARSGQVVGGGIYDPYYPYFALRWPTAYTPTSLPKPSVNPPWGSADATGINSEATPFIVGTVVNPIGVSRAVRWSNPSTPFVGDPNSPFTDLRSLVQQDNNTQSSYAYGVNNRRFTVGKAQTFSGKHHAFLVRADEPNITPADDLGVLFSNGTYDFSEARHISQASQIAGATTVAVGQTNAFVKQPATGQGQGFVNLGNLGGNYAVATCVNNRGQAVGWSKKSNGGAAAFIKLPGQTIKDLTSLVDASWVLQTAEGITDDGKVVGTAYRNGRSVGYVLYPQ